MLMIYAVILLLPAVLAGKKGGPPDKDCPFPCSCYLPKEIGPCKAIKPRLYFTTKGTCEVFNYGGCGGNCNRFKTVEECLERCARVDECCLDSDPGPCEAATTRYFYSRTTSHCETFIYGGCEGNKNNFEKIEDCEKACKNPRCSPCP